MLRRAIQDAVHAVAVRVCLTRRERSVFTRLAMGYGHAAIAAELGISARTVKMHATSLRNKTGTGSRSALLQVLFAA